MIPTGRPTIFVNPRADRRAPYDEAGRPAILSQAALSRAAQEISSWPGYGQTPLRDLTGVASEAGVAAVHYKDEGGRFGLGSFKALGGAYAVLRLLQQVISLRTGAHASSAEIAAGEHAGICGALTVACATDGNHGRSVAWGARTFGCGCVIYVHEGVSEGRRDAIARYGAEVRQVAGNYDDAVRRAASDAAAHGWHVVSDTSYEGYTDIPRDVMQGYGVMVDEALAQLAGRPLPTHVFVQGGVGGAAAAVCATLWERLGARRPRFIVVEPDRADCLYRSAVSGRPVAVLGELDTIMAGLACGEVSLLAWEILKDGADAFMTVQDAAAAAAMRRLACPSHGDLPVVAGESAVAGLAALLEISRDAHISRTLGLGADSVVLLFGTEGATDPALYAGIVGRTPDEVLSP